MTSYGDQATIESRYRQILTGLCLLLLQPMLTGCSDDDLRSGGEDGAVSQDGLVLADSASAADLATDQDSAPGEAGPSVDAGTPATDGTIFSDGAVAVPARDRPFDPIHPIYQPIPANCQLDPTSTEVINYIINNGHNTFLFDVAGETPPIYVGAANDPIWTLQIQGQAFNVHAPMNIQAGTGSDYPLIILDESSTTYGNNPVEYRMWQATIDQANKEVTCNGGGVGVYANDGRIHSYGKGGRALGQAEIFGQNTGSGNSYTVGMIRPLDIIEGRIPHAIRVATAYIGGTFIWPATKTDQSGSVPPRAPMGARIFLDHSVNLTPIYNGLASRLSDPLNLKLAELFVQALQEYGMMMSDGTGQGHNVYFENEMTADWVPLIGPVNAYGSYNDVARAVEKEIPWDQLRVAHPDVFDAYGK